MEKNRSPISSFGVFSVILAEVLGCYLKPINYVVNIQHVTLLKAPLIEAYCTLKQMFSFGGVAMGLFSSYPILSPRFVELGMMSVPPACFLLLAQQSVWRWGFLTFGRCSDSVQQKFTDRSPLVTSSAPLVTYRIIQV